MGKQNQIRNQELMGKQRRIRKQGPMKKMRKQVSQMHSQEGVVQELRIYPADPFLVMKRKSIILHLSMMG